MLNLKEVKSCELKDPVDRGRESVLSLVVELLVTARCLHVCGEKSSQIWNNLTHRPESQLTDVVGDERGDKLLRRERVEAEGRTEDALAVVTPSLDTHSEELTYGMINQPLRMKRMTEKGSMRLTLTSFDLTKGFLTYSPERKVMTNVMSLVWSEVSKTVGL